MPRVSASKALDFVRAAELPTIWRAKGVAGTETAVAKFDFNKDKDQAIMVGSEIVSFVRGISEERRSDIVNSTLLAQLVAKKNVGDASLVFPWYKSYFDTLTNIGWVIQDRQFVDHSEQSSNVDAHEAILNVATSLLGPATAALQVVKATLDALKSMGADNPFITLFNRESQHANTARFQVSLAEDDENGQFLVTLMAFALSAQSDLTQVLFLRFRNNDVEIKHASGKVTINAEVLSAVRNSIQQRLIDFTADYIKSLPDLG